MAAKRKAWASTWVRGGALTLVLAAAATYIATLDMAPSLGHIDLAVLSGPTDGNYHASVDALADAARRHKGVIENVATAGSMDNLDRLATPDPDCRSAFAVVQDGLPWPEEAGLQLIGRLKKSESFFLLGKSADRFHRFSDLQGARIAIGSDGSGTSRVAKAIFGTPELTRLQLTLETHATTEGLALAESGGVDLVAIVIDEDAELIKKAVLERHLGIAPLENLDALARRFPFLRTGRIGAGQYDAVALLPPSDRTVLRVDTLIVGRGCVKRSRVVALLGLLTELYPDFVRHNQETPNRTGLPLSEPSKRYFQNGGPEFLDTWLPRVSDVMPPENWVYTVMGLSVLFNIMGFANRYRLWRIDANREAIEHRLGRLFGATTTIQEIGELVPTAEHLAPATAAALDDAITAIERLVERCRTQSLSMLVPMGGEMTYRYQESLMLEALANLRSFRVRLRAVPPGDPAPTPTTVAA